MGIREFLAGDTVDLQAGIVVPNGSNVQVDRTSDEFLAGDTVDLQAGIVVQNGSDKNMVLVNDEQDSGTDEFLAGNIGSDDLVPEQGSGKEIIPETKVIETVGIYTVLAQQ